MSTPNRIKLRNAGDAIVLHCESVSVNTSGKWPEIEFIGIDAKTHQRVIVSAPQKSMERQFDRLGLSLTECSKYTLGISRAASDDPAKPYWNLAVIGEQTEKESFSDYLPGTPVRGTAPISAPPVAPPPTDADAPPDAVALSTATTSGFAGDPLYLAITQWVLATVAPLYGTFEIGPTPEAIAAMVATVYIQHNRGR